MKFKYVGDCEKGEVVFRGITFKKDEAVEVEDEAAQAKLENNSHFQKVVTRRKKVDGDNNES